MCRVESGLMRTMVGEMGRRIVGGGVRIRVGRLGRVMLMVVSLVCERCLAR